MKSIAKAVIIVIGILIFYYFFFMKKSSYMIPPPRKTDQQVEVQSVADIAVTSGACGVPPGPM